MKRLGSSEECLATALRFSNTQVTSADWLFSANIACQHFRLICVNVCFAKRTWRLLAKKENNKNCSRSFKGNKYDTVRYDSSIIYMRRVKTLFFHLSRVFSSSHTSTFKTQRRTVSVEILLSWEIFLVYQKRHSAHFRDVLILLSYDQLLEFSVCLYIYILCKVWFFFLFDANAHL